jgi:predicted ferric reductase
MSYESWQLMHSVLAVLVVATGLLHALLVGYYISQPWEKGLWAAMTAGLVGLGIWVRIVKPLQRQRHKWRVLGVAAEPNSSYTVTLAPDSPTVTPFSFRPGQFAWLLTGSSTPFALTYHPFSISSSAEDTSRVSFTIKDTGDFTDAVSRLQSGDIIYVDGPWGEFTMDRHEGPGFVLIAAGIGVTPMLSMLKTLADRDDRRPCWLFLGNRDQDSVACQGELDALTPRLDLEIVHVLSHAQPGWNGETGYLRAEIFDRHLPKGRVRLQYFICGPPAMMRSSEEALAQLHIPRDHVHVERFAMV